VDLDVCLEQNSVGRPISSMHETGRAANDSLHDAHARLNTNSQYFHGKKVSAPLHMCACTSAYAFFAESMHAFLTGIMSTMHVQVCMLDRCCEHQCTHLLHARYRMYICAYACAVCFIFALGNEDREVQLVYEGTWCLAWGVIFDRRKDRGVGGYF